ncbi:MAG TPA: hypothetical protein VL137_17775 [Polyangiaceae bacterium]|nr:hypothetical protein [Polyangiaceae bacterium]
MKRSLFAGLALLIVTGCHRSQDAEGPMERAGKGVDKAAQKTGQAVSKAASKTGTAIKKAAHATGNVFVKAGQKLKGESGDASSSRR